MLNRTGFLSKKLFLSKKKKYNVDTWGIYEAEDGRMVLCDLKLGVGRFSLPCALTPNSTVKPYIMSLWLNPIMSECVGVCRPRLGPKRPAELYVCLWSSHKWVCVITAAIVVTEREPTQKSPAHGALTYDPQLLVSPIRPLPSLHPANPPSTSSRSPPTHPFLSGDHRSLGWRCGAAAGKWRWQRDGRIENREIDPIYEFSTTFATDFSSAVDWANCL